VAELKQELTTLDLCKMFNVSRQTIFNWRRKGLEYYKLGGNGLNDPTRYALDSVINFTKGIDKEASVQIFS